MRDQAHSLTALRVACRRAAHQLLDRPPVFPDPLALAVLGPAGAQEVRADPGRWDGTPTARLLRAFLAVRSRVAEETLAALVAGGLRQYVVLGAGLDTFACRSPFPDLAVYEVDHPATQAWKRVRLAEASLDPRIGARFVPVAFERQALEEELARAGLDFDRPTFFSWLGVTPYLTVEAVARTLEQAGKATRTGGGIVFDYAVTPDTLSGPARAAFERMAARVAEAGEPWRAFFDPGELGGRLTGLGFGWVEDLSGDELNRRYFAGRPDGLRVGSMGHVMVALRSDPAAPSTFA